MARTWNAVLARLGVPTGDGRIVDPAGGSSRSLPLPLRWVPADVGAHDGAVVVGRIETMRIADGMVTATGSMLDSAPWEVIEQLEAGVIGPSVDLDDIEYVMDDQERLIVTKWRVAGATLVAIPAFADVSLTLDPVPAEPMGEPSMPGEDMYAPLYGLTASVRTSGWGDMPIADAGRSWDGAAAAERVFNWAGGPDPENVDWSRYARAFLRKDDDADPETKGAYSFGIADVIDGTLTIVPAGVHAAAAAVQGARTGETPKDAEGMRSVLRSIYERMDERPPFSAHVHILGNPDGEQPMDDWDNCRDPQCPGPFSLAASAGVAVLPPAEWFTRPDLDRLTPLTVSDTGRVFGHIAGWETCHIGLPGCVTPPSSPTQYTYFHVSEQPVQGGAVLPVGTLVAGPRHADAQLAFQAAQQHYDDPSAAVAKVVAGEDDYGIWVAGWLLPGADPAAVEVFRTSPVSGDWRRVGGALELIAVCSVNAPGFPVPRARVHFAHGAQRALVGAFGITPVSGSYEDATGPQTGAERMMDTETARARWAWAKTQMEG